MAAARVSTKTVHFLARKKGYRGNIVFWVGGFIAHLKSPSPPYGPWWKPLTWMRATAAVQPLVMAVKRG